MEKPGQRLVPLKRRTVRLQPADERLLWKVGNSDLGRQVDPVLPEPGFGIADCDPGLGSLDLGLEEVLLVRLAQIEKLLGGLHGLLGVFRQQTFVLDRQLGREDVEVRGGQPVDHLQPLRLGLDLREFGLLLILLPAEPELPAGHDLLLEGEERPLPGPPGGSDVLAGDPSRRVVL